MKLNHLVPTQFPLPNLKLELCLLCQGPTTTLQKIFILGERDSGFWKGAEGLSLLPS